MKKYPERPSGPDDTVNSILEAVEINPPSQVPDIGNFGGGFLYIQWYS